MVGLSISEFAAASSAGLSYPIMKTATADNRQSESDIIRNHEKLIRFFAAPFASKGVLLDDLVQEGNIALLASSRTWRADGGASLWTWAIKSVRGAMFLLATKEIGERRHVDLSSSESDGEHVDESVSAESALELKELGSILEDAMTECTPVERSVVDLYLNEDLSFRQIAERLSLSSNDKAERTYRAAIAKLRERVQARL